MMARNYKSKAAKDRVNYITSDSNALSDFFYTTESNNSRFDYRDERGLRYGDPYFDSYNSRRSIESLDVDTSATSYIERNPKHASPRSKSEKIYSRKYSNSPTRRIHSPNRDYEETRRRSSPRTHYILDSTSEQTLRYRPRNRDNSYMHDELSYEKYFEPADSRPRERSLSRSDKRRRIQERSEHNEQGKRRRPSPKPDRGKEYQIYAYKDDKPHDKVFMGETKERRKSPLASEIELKTHEYPVLGFKNRNTVTAKDSDMVYVPVLVIDNNSKKLKNKPAPTVEKNLGQPENFQVYAANVRNKNVFEKMVDTNYKKTSSGTPYRQSFTEQNLSQNQHSYLNPQSLVGFDSILNQKSYISRSAETEAPLKLPFGHKQQSFIYNVNVDVAPDFENDSKRMSQTRRPTNDNLHDDFPVTKDYIKVSEGEERKSFVTPTRQSVKPDDRNPSVFVEVITNEKISQSIADSKDAAGHKSNVKASFVTRTPVIPESDSPKRSTTLENRKSLAESPKRSRVEAKSGSLAISSDIPREEGAEIRNTQGMTRLSQIEGPERLSPTRHSTKESSVMNATGSPQSRKSTVSYPSPTVTFTKQPSIYEARASQTAVKKLSAVQARPSLAVPQSRASTPIAEITPESRKSLAQPPPPQVTPTPNEATLKELRKSVQTQEEVKAGLEEQRKSKLLAEPEIAPQELNRPSRTPKSTRHTEESEEALMEFTKTVLQEDYVKDPSLLDPNADVPVRKSGVKSEDPPKDENTKLADLKSQPLDEEPNESRILSDEKVISVVNFSQAVKDNDNKHMNDALKNEETAMKDQPSLKGTQREEKDPAPVVQPRGLSPEPKQVDGKKSTVIKPTSKKSYKVPKKSESQISNKSESNVQKKGFLSKVFKKSESGQGGVGDTRSKSVVGKSSKQSVAKLKKTDSNRSVGKSILKILSRTKSYVSNKSTDSTPEEPPTDVQEEGRQVRRREIKEGNPKESEPCECLIGYVRQVRECGHFFLGTTLYEHVMQMLEIIW